jgi:hypothetical protein
MTLLSLAMMLGSKVNPRPRDGWFETHYIHAGLFPA